MLLTGDEVEILREHVVPFRGPHAEGRGTFFLTSARLVVEEPRTRRLRPAEVHTVLDVPLDAITNASVASVLRRPRYLLIEMGAQKLRAEVVDPTKWVHALQAAKVGPPRVAPPPVAAHSTTVHTIERQVVKVRCRHCGTLSDEVLSRCPSCGAPLSAAGPASRAGRRGPAAREPATGIRRPRQGSWAGGPNGGLAVVGRASPRAVPAPVEPRRAPAPWHDPARLRFGRLRSDPSAHERLICVDTGATRLWPETSETILR